MGTSVQVMMTSTRKTSVPLAIYQATGIYECRMKAARLAVEAEMIAEGNGPGEEA